MADGLPTESAFARRPGFLWTEIFRSFWVALDPRKLIVAAAGILAVSLGWYVLSTMAMGLATAEPKRDGNAYTNEKMALALGKLADGTDRSPETLAAEGTKRFNADYASWASLNDLAGEGGLLRTLPWNEYRGKNPYLFATTVVGGSPVEQSDAVKDFVSAQLPMLLEPLRKLLLPVIKITAPNTGFGTRVYCLLCLVWSLAVWAFCGGVITRIAAVQLSGKDRISLSQAVQFVTKRYTAYLLSPILPLGVIAAIVVALIFFGLLGLIPLVGDVLILALLFPLAILAGVVMAVLLVGLVGYPLMYTTLSVEGSDTFDAMSRAYNYVYQAPWRFLWYSAVAIVYGMAVTFFVVFMGSLSVYLGKWGTNQTASAIYSTHTPDYLFLNAPKTLGWRELLLKGSDIEQVSDVQVVGSRKILTLKDKDEETAKKYRESYYWYHHFASWVVSFWLLLMLLMLLGFGYSYFWSAATSIYVLMRKAVDDTELDEIYLEDDAADTPLPAPPITVPPPPSLAGGTSLPMVPPSAPTEPPPSVPFTGPVGAIKPTPSPEGPKT